MLRVLHSAVKRSIVLKGRSSVPAAVSSVCGCCGELVSFTLEGHQSLGGTKVSGATGKCPSCDEDSAFIFLLDTDSNGNLEWTDVFVTPIPEEVDRAPVKGHDQLPEPVQRAYKASLDCYNARVWPAVAATARRVLEAVTKTELDEENRKKALFKQLEELTNNRDLLAPLKKLTHQIRQGGNIGAHFDEEKEPDQRTAAAMLDLLEYMLEYLYVLPSQIDDLEKRLEQLGKEEND